MKKMMMVLKVFLLILIIVFLSIFTLGRFLYCLNEVPRVDMLGIVEDWDKKYPVLSKATRFVINVFDI